MLSGLLTITAALAQEPDALPPGAYSANVRGSWITGNLDQLQLNAGGQLRTYAPNYGNDLIVSAYRLWTGLPDVPGLPRIGDDITVSTLPFYNIGERYALIGLGHYAQSQLHQSGSVQREQLRERGALREEIQTAYLVCGGVR